ncbi:uncharacterized protein [Cicer arietinum]|uniref:Uncharacterized protein LOC101499564 n=1 Tax=Cicer arietinum TaxID=3827 RepID=A0A1S2Z4B1_CICAR|nr:uncharacterized protein LOC101499564 [Cicer arietinum]
MHVPLIDRLSDFQLGFNSLQNPSFSSQITTTSFNGIQSVSIAFNFCKWGAVILALVATFSSIINKVTVFIIHLRKKASSLPSIAFDDDDDYTTSDDEDSANDDDVISYSSSSDFEEEPSISSSSSFHEFFRVSGSSYRINDEFQSLNDRHKRQRSIGDIFSLFELAKNENVVKLWDSIGFGLGLDFDDYEDGVFSSKNDVVSKQHAPSSSVASPAVVVSAGEGGRGNLAVEIWDTRLRRRKPSVVAEWGPTVGTVRVESGGVQKVYVTDNGRDGLTVGDMRKVSMPLGNVTEVDAYNTWWDADAVVVSDES